jgi:hypothetical protein
MQKSTRLGLIMVVTATLLLVASTGTVAGGGMCESVGDLVTQCTCDPVTGC